MLERLLDSLAMLLVSVVLLIRMVPFRRHKDSIHSSRPDKVSNERQKSHEPHTKR
jgi:hypothetical protein